MSVYIRLHHNPDLLYSESLKILGVRPDLWHPRALAWIYCTYFHAVAGRILLYFPLPLIVTLVPHWPIGSSNQPCLPIYGETDSDNDVVNISISCPRPFGFGVSSLLPWFIVAVAST